MVEDPPRREADTSLQILQIVVDVVGQHGSLQAHLHPLLGVQFRNVGGTSVALDRLVLLDNRSNELGL